MATHVRKMLVHLINLMVTPPGSLILLPTLASCLIVIMRLDSEDFQRFIKPHNEMVLNS